MNKRDSENLQRIADALDPPGSGPSTLAPLPGFVLSAIATGACLVGLKIGYEMSKTIDHSPWGFVGLLLVLGCGIGSLISGWWTLMGAVSAAFRVFR